MKCFYLVRHVDVNGLSGTGVVAEGIIFDSKMCAMTWLTEYPTVTVFPNITVVKKLHGHEGATEVIIEGKSKKFEECKQKLLTERKKERRKK
jgi:hypothetical protein